MNNVNMWLPLGWRRLDVNCKCKMSVCVRLRFWTCAGAMTAILFLNTYYLFQTQCLCLIIKTLYRDNMTTE